MATKYLKSHSRARFLMITLLYITPALAYRSPPQPPQQPNPNISSGVNQNTVNQINKLFTKATYKDFHKQPKLKLFKIPTSNHEH